MKSLVKELLSSREILDVLEAVRQEKQKEMVKCEQQVSVLTLDSQIGVLSFFLMSKEVYYNKCLWLSYVENW